MNAKYYLGIDCGSVSVKIAVINGQNEIIWRDYQRTHGEPLKQLKTIVTRMFVEIATPIQEFEGIYATGSGRFLIKDLLNALVVNEITTHGMGGAYFYPEAKAIIEIGGQDSKLIILDKLANGETVIFDSQMNDVCAAGTGSFLDQQAYRMGLTIEELSQKACQSQTPAKVSGRCSVFAKTDLIHLQQDGVSQEDLAAGLCMAVARNYVENLVKGRTIKTPVLFQGGAAKNEGLKKAFLRLLGLDEHAIIIPEYFGEMGAIGSVLYGRKKQVFNRITKAELLDKLNLISPAAVRVNELQVLSEQNIVAACYPLKSLDHSAASEVYIGIDVGSVSAKIAVIDAGRNILFKHYTVSDGDPNNAVKECFAKLKQSCAAGIVVKGIGVTGSGRDYIANLWGADVVRNEITAQARGITTLVPDVNTIIEIGGQDSKFIKVENGTVTDFVMNKTCAAGTGSFLAEQADRLKVELSAFSQLALESKAPLDMGTRCTVFMETDCIHYQQKGCAKSDILAGLSYSIAKNYLEKVVGNRPIDGKVVIQGGIAFNHSVVAAFGNILNRKITIAPHHEVTGALGMAFIAREAMMGQPASKFIGFEVKNQIIEQQTIQCHDCSNVCNLIRLKYQDGRRSIHGSICGKFDKSKNAVDSGDIIDYFEERKKLLLSYDRSTGAGKGKIGIPRMLLFHELFPLWATFFNAIGYDIALSEEISKSIYEKGIAKVLVDTCFPIRNIYGVVINLMERGVDKIFLPYIINMEDDGYQTKHAHNCQYIQQIPDFIKASLEVELLTPTVRMKGKKARVEKAFVEMAEQLGVAKLDAKRAYHRARQAQKEFYQDCKAIGIKALQNFSRFQKTFVLIGHVYIIHDKFFNLNLVKRLAGAGIPAIAADMLPLDETDQKARLIDLNWKTNNRAVNALEFIHHYNLANQHQLLPVIITQFGCAADSMLTPYLKDIMGDRPWLELEVDEHNSVTGLMTRCEAFWESVVVETVGKKAFEAVEQLRVTSLTLRQVKEQARKVYILPFSEAMYAVPEVLTKYGVQSEMIQKTTTYSNDLGRKYSNEKHCRTYQVILGDFLATIQKPDFDDRKAAFFMFDYDEACRLSLFKSLYTKVLKEHGAKDLKILGTVVDDPLGWISAFGVNPATEVWLAMIAADYLFRFKFELRPYELKKGAVDQAYERAKALLYRGIKESQILTSFKQALGVMKHVPLVQRDLVRIGIIGDAFTRVHEYGMTEIFEIVEAMNGVVLLPPSWHDFINYGSERRVTDLWEKGSYARTVATKFGSMTLNCMRKKVQEIAAVYSEMFMEPDNRELSEYAQGYVNLKIAPVIPSMFIGKTVDFVTNKNVHGLINAYGFNCCLGKVTTACINKLRIENGDIPMFTFIDDGLQQTNIRTRVEAFMEQAWAYRNKIHYHQREIN